MDDINKTDKPQAYQSKKVNLLAMNQTRVCHWINQGRWINKGLIK